MKQMKIFMLIFCIVFTLFLSGCLSLASTPAPRFYMLRSINKAEVSQQFNIASDTIIVVGPVKIPEYQDRPQIVTQDKDKMLTFAQFDRWGRPLDLGVAQVIADGLTAMLPGATIDIFPSHFNIPVKYQVLVDVIKLESEIDKDMFFVAQWSIINLEHKKMLFTKRSEFTRTINPHNYSGLAEALSATCISLSNAIAKEFSVLLNQEKIP